MLRAVLFDLEPGVISEVKTGQKPLKKGLSTSSSDLTNLLRAGKILATMPVTSMLQ
jgi:hypothetical protein